MIELKNVSKTYKSKKGNKTKALDNISLKLEEKGMTFILGKSGSGKSTLLNILGGLDKYDSGDMTILGKSSRDFKAADFDSYRNTYIGFVFQEFNILEDYNVYENIVLALQLQQKDVNKEKIDNLLDKLELSDLKNRKVNELSGGQKQRVAIARALIKDPKIILADEPTGNLDSKTGKQVMDLLKEISKEKLVIIVSHDTESAKTYGDRIIEIKDGKVVKDTKEKITIDNKDIYKPIKSILPFKDSFKLGIGSLRHKKIKLVFTILLTICALLFLSIIDTLSSYNVEEAHSKLLVDEKEDSIKVEKYYFSNNKYDKYDFYNKDQVKLTLDDEKYIKSKLKNKYYPIYKLQESYSFMQVGEALNIGDIIHNNPYLDMGAYYPLNIVVVDNFNDFKTEKIIGRYPTNYNEILISNYMADLIIEGGITTYEKNDVDEFSDDYTFKPKNYEDIINSNKTFYFGSKGKVKIVGIINYDLSKYSSLKNKSDNYENMTKDDWNLRSELNLKESNLYNNVYVTNEFIEKLDVATIEELDENTFFFNLNSDGLDLQSDGYYIAPAIIQNELEYYDGSKWVKTKKLNKNDIVINIHQLMRGGEQDYEKGLEKYITNNPNVDRETLEKRYFVNYIKDLDVIGKKANLKVRNRIDEIINDYKDLNIIGITGFSDTQNRNYYLSNDLVGEYKIEVIQKTGYLVPMSDYKDFKYMLTTFPYNNEIQAVSPYSEEVTMLVRTIEILKDIAFYVSLVLFIFTVFLIGNFIMTSINYRKKEIGVLRALGARSVDIIKIFLWEGIVMSFISATISSILLVLVTKLLNTVIMAGTNLILTPFILNIRQFVLIYVVVFIVTIISSIIPILKISKMKPIDAILKK